MAGITFNLILIRVNQDRARVTDTYLETGDAIKKKTMLSRLRFRTNHSTVTDTSTALSTNFSTEQQDAERAGMFPKETEN